MGISNTIPPSRLIQPGVVANTAARPTRPFTGQAIYQADTDEVLYYNGTSWSRPWNMPWGIVTVTNAIASDNTITAEEVQITGSSFTAVVNRNCRITYFEPDAYNGTGIFTFRIRLTNLAGTLLQTSYHTTGTAVERTGVTMYVGTLTAGSTNVVATAQQSAGTGICSRTATQFAFLLVEDIGPT